MYLQFAYYGPDDERYSVQKDTIFALIITLFNLFFHGLVHVFAVLPLWFDKYKDIVKKWTNQYF